MNYPYIKNHLQQTFIKLVIASETIISFVASDRQNNYNLILKDFSVQNIS